MRHPGTTTAVLCALAAVALLTGAGAQKGRKNPARPAKPAAPAAAPTRPLSWEPLGEPGSGGWMTGCRVSPHDPKRVLVGGDLLGVGLSTDAGRTWRPTFGLRSYEMGDFTWHPKKPDVVWAGSMSGSYLSTDGGRTWQERRGGFPPVSDGGYSAPVEKVLFDPKNPERLIALGGSSRRWESPGQPLWGAVWESRDGGANWAQISRLPGNVVSGAFAAGRSDALIVGVSGRGLFRSSDGGKTWTPANGGLPHPNVERIVPHPSDPKTFWAALDNFKPEGAAVCKPGGIYKTEDGGKTWQGLNGGLSQAATGDPNLTARYKGFAVASSDPGVMVCCDGAWNAGVIYGTRDGGRSWRPLATKGNRGHPDDPARETVFKVDTAYPAGLGETVIEIDPRNPNTVFAMGAEHILASTDGGRTWEERGAQRVAGTDRWRGRGFNGLCATAFRFDPQTPGRALLVALDAGKCWETSDGLKTWARRGEKPWPWGGGEDAWVCGPTAYVAYGQFGGFQGVGRTRDGGKSWETLEPKGRGLPESGWQNGIYARRDAPDQVWLCVGGSLYHSGDAGENWREVKSGLGMRWIAGDPKDSARFFVSGDRNVYETRDGGATFAPIGGPKPAHRLAVDAKGRLYAVAYHAERAGLWRYDGTPGGWTRLFDDYHTSNVAADPSDPNRLAVCTNDDPYHDVTRASGVWVSADAGKTWAQATDGLPVLRGHALAFDPHISGRLVFGTQGRGFFVARWPKGYAPKAARTYASIEEDARHAAVYEPPKPGSKIIALRNADMEEGADAPAMWDNRWEGRGKVRAVRDTGTFKTGKASLRLESVGGEAQGQITQVVEAEPGRTLTVSGWVKTQGRVRVNVMAQPMRENWQPIGFLQLRYAQGDSDWAWFEKTITLPEGAARFGLGLLLEGDGRAWLDGVKLSGKNVKTE